MGKITYCSGFLQARLVGINESNGEEEFVEGRLVRIRCAAITGYSAGLQGTVQIDVFTYDEPIEIMAAIEDVDQVMSRDRIYEIGKMEPSVVQVSKGQM